MGLAGVALSSILPGRSIPGGIATADAVTTNMVLGDYVPSLPWSFADQDSFDNLMGRRQKLVHWFQDWVMPFDRSYLDAAVNRGATPLISWEPWKFGGGINQLNYALRTIAAGQHDAYIRNWARAAAAWGKPLYLAFAHEMNGDWTSWSPGVNGNTAAQFVSAWRRVHGIFRQAGATNVRWVWAPVAQYQVFGTTPYKAVYPGNAYVNWTGMSGYNWGNTRSWSRWLSFSQIFGASYGVLNSIAPNKPVMIREVGSTESGGDKAAWIKNAFLSEIPGKFPRLQVVAWFHWRRRTTGGSTLPPARCRPTSRWWPTPGTKDGCPNPTRHGRIGTAGTLRARGPKKDPSPGSHDAHDLDERLGAGNPRLASRVLRLLAGHETPQRPARGHEREPAYKQPDLLGEQYHASRGGKGTRRYSDSLTVHLTISFRTSPKPANTPSGVPSARTRRRVSR